MGSEMCIRDSPLPSPPGRWALNDVKALLGCIVQAWPLCITVLVFPYEDQQEIFEHSGSVLQCIQEHQTSIVNVKLVYLQGCEGLHGPSNHHHHHHNRRRYPQLLSLCDSRRDTLMLRGFESWRDFDASAITKSCKTSWASIPMRKKKTEHDCSRQIKSRQDPIHTWDCFEFAYICSRVPPLRCAVLASTHYIL